MNGNGPILIAFAVYVFAGAEPAAWVAIVLFSLAVVVNVIDGAD